MKMIIVILIMVIGMMFGVIVSNHTASEKYTKIISEMTTTVEGLVIKNDQLYNCCQELR